MLLILAMILTSPMPFDLAVKRLESKTAVGTSLSTAELSKLDQSILDRAFFSARVEDLRTAAAMQNDIRDALALQRRDGVFIDKANFIARQRALLGAAPGDSRDLTDITSAKRLGLVYDFNKEDAMEYGRWLARQDPDILRMFPCSELVRVESRIVPRGYRKGPGGRLVEVPEESWPARWVALGGKIFNGRMIARKDDPIWKAISRFGRPWPPFDFMSGMGLADVGVDEAEQLGVIPIDAPPPKPQALDFNHNLQATVSDASPALLAAFRKIFGATAEISAEGKIIFLGGRPPVLDEALISQLGEEGSS